MNFLKISSYFHVSKSQFIKFNNNLKLYSILDLLL